MANGERASRIIDEALQKENGLAWKNQYDPPMSGAQALEVARRAFDAYIDDVGVPLEKDLKKLKEQIGLLCGTLNANAIGKSAVRFEDLRYLDRFPSRPPNLRYASGAPTADDYNALYEDVRKLYELLGSLAVIVGRRI